MYRIDLLKLDQLEKNLQAALEFATASEHNKDPMDDFRNVYDIIKPRYAILTALISEEHQRGNISLSGDFNIDETHIKGDEAYAKKIIALNQVRKYLYSAIQNIDKRISPLAYVAEAVMALEKLFAGKVA